MMFGIPRDFTFWTGVGVWCLADWDFGCSLMVYNTIINGTCFRRLSFPSIEDCSDGRQSPQPGHGPPVRPLVLEATGLRKRHLCRRAAKWRLALTLAHHRHTQTHAVAHCLWRHVSVSRASQSMDATLPLAGWVFRPVQLLAKLVLPGPPWSSLVFPWFSLAGPRSGSIITRSRSPSLLKKVRGRRRDLQLHPYRI